MVIKTFDLVPKHTFDIVPKFIKTFNLLVWSSEIRSSDHFPNHPVAFSGAHKIETMTFTL